MNKDLDERLVPKGEYREAQNILITQSESSDVGAIENIQGNALAVPMPTIVGNMETIGYYADNLGKKVFWFITDFTGDDGDIRTMSRAQSTNTCQILMADLNNTSEEAKIIVQGHFLNFSKNHLITGINLIDDLLFFTDNYNQPRKINVTKAIADNTYYTQFSGSAPTAKGSGSAIGTVSYDHGLIMITDTGSYSNTGGTDSDSNGWTLNFDSTKTIYEHEYTCIVPEGQFNNSTNISVSLNRSGSLTVPAGLDMNLMRDIVSAPGESYYDTGSGYTATTQTENFATHSAFMPYITTVGLYNDHGDLLAIAKTSRPIKNDTELALSFIVRFDI